MARARPIRHADLRGAARLATEATAGLADLVEAVHERIARLPGLPAPAQAGRTRGITGLVYRSVRGVTRVVGGSVDLLLGLLTPTLAPGAATAEPLPQREALLAALNGVLGDHLAATANPLATPMALRQAGRALPIDDAAALAAQLQGTGPDVLVLIHGLCMNDLQWEREGHDHGATLAAALGFTPVYVHHNSGLPIATNGRLLAAQLETLLAHWPQPVRRLVLLGHSMGGLIARSAVRQAQQRGQRWPQALTDLVCLGTPHHGAPLEKAGRWIDLLLAATPYSAPFARLGRLRSAGITDLRHGHVLDGEPVPLPQAPQLRCFAMASTLGEPGGSLKGRVLGDGLVPLASALGRHRDPARRLAFEPAHQWVGHGIGHMALLSDSRVSQQLLHWLRR